MRTLIFATNNKNKVNELRSVVKTQFDIISLQEAGIKIDIPEPHATLEENASEKSQTIFQLTGGDCFSEDTGLEVDELNGAPGVKSARYAGEQADSKQNIEKLLLNLEKVKNRKARFRTVISLIINGEEYQFTGICEGSIDDHQTGDGGFGYDSIFIPDGSTKSFGMMSMDEKNIYSHRKKATAKLIDFLNDYNVKNKN